jgi:hypothetical protein
VALVAASTTACRYCKALVVIPQTHLEALTVQQQAARLRREVEPRWRKMTAQAAWWTEWVAAALILFLPPFVSVVAVFALWFPLSMVDGIMFFAIPSLLPGGALWVWSIASRATAQRLDRGMWAGPPKQAGGSPTCRGCGAPLTVEPEALAATCVYCGTDSVLGSQASGDVSQAAGAKVRTLKDALRTWRMRVVLLGFGVIALAVPMVGLAILVWAGLRSAM